MGIFGERRQSRRAEGSPKAYMCRLFKGTCARTCAGPGTVPIRQAMRNHGCEMWRGIKVCRKGLGVGFTIVEQYESVKAVQRRVMFQHPMENQTKQEPTETNKSSARWNLDLPPPCGNSGERWPRLECLRNGALEMGFFVVSSLLGPRLRAAASRPLLRQTRPPQTSHQGTNAGLLDCGLLRNEGMRLVLLKSFVCLTSVGSEGDGGEAGVLCEYQGCWFLPNRQSLTDTGATDCQSWAGCVIFSSSAEKIEKTRMSVGPQSISCDLAHGKNRDKVGVLVRG